MQFTVQIPDDIARRALQGLALEEFKSGHISKPELRRLLGFDNRYDLDEFLKLHRVVEDYTADEIEREVEALQRLGY